MYVVDQDNTKFLAIRLWSFTSRLISPSWKKRFINYTAVNVTSKNLVIVKICITVTNSLYKFLLEK